MGKPRRRNLPKLYACFGYTDSFQPSGITIYRDREASDPVAQIPVDLSNANRPSTFQHDGTTYRLEWLD
ncbi:MAG: hypothetical protein HC828_01515 [Blastochloris sp.]|nr:hypothetical protein [Blastochloris sp.]